MRTITGGGTFTRQNINDINANFGEVLTQADIWVRPQAVGASDTNDGSFARPFKTMTNGANRLLEPGIRVGLEGVLLEEYSSRKVNDVTLVGAVSNLPRQATTSGAPNGGGATWLSPASGTGALLQPNGQGWLIQNIFFNNSATAAPCIKLVNAGDPPTSNCSEKTSIIGCWLTGTDDGIGAVDLPNNVLIDGCTIFGFSGAGDLGISSATGAGVGTLSFWTIQNCDFLGNAGHITAPFNSSTIRNNHFSYIYGAVTSTTQIVLTSGSNNSIYNNRFDVPYNQAGLTAMFASGTADRWGSNSMGTAVLTPMTGQLWGVPVSGAA